MLFYLIWRCSTLIKYKTEKYEYKDAEEGLIDLFSDIVELETQCNFSDCLHETEPGCAVKKVIRDVKLSNKRLESYRKLQREMLAVERKKKPKLAEKRSGKK